jgi:hypothetical protein
MAETLPPMTQEELLKALGNDTWKSYVYIGKAGDKGWRVARAAEAFLARVRAYLVKKADLLDGTEIEKNKPGIVFGWGAKPVKYLTQAQCKDLLIVMEEITEAGE